jgi:hypothetical protein
MNEAEITTRAQLERRLAARAAADAEFRARLLAEPKQAIAEEVGIEVPGEVAVEVLEESPGQVYLVVPAPGEALSDEQLAEVAGGIYHPWNAILRG